MAKKKVPDQKMDIMPEGVLAPYGIRKTFNHVVNVKKKRTNSLVRMKPLKDRQQIYDVPEFCPQGYTREEFDLYREEFQRIKQHTKEDLKEVLKLNKQDTSVNSRAEILNRCADGYALGRIPKCPACYGTNPVYNKYTGTYLCPGYKEGDSFVKCDTTYSKDELKRTMDWDNDFARRQAIRLQRTQKKNKHEREYQIQYKRAKKKRLAREERRRNGLPSESEDDEKKQGGKTEYNKKEATIKKQSEVIISQDNNNKDEISQSIVDKDEDYDDDENENDEQERKIESQNEGQEEYSRMISEKDSKRMESEREE